MLMQSRYDTLQKIAAIAHAVGHGMEICLSVYILRTFSLDEKMILLC